MMKNIIIIAALLLSTTIAEAQNQRSRVRQNNTNTSQARTGAGGQRSASTPSFNQVLTTRRSVRNYDATKKISEAEVRMLLKSVQDAPSWANMQPTKYYVAISEEKLTAVQNMVGGNKERIKNAPVLIVSTYERGKSGFFQGNPANEVGDGWGAYDNGLSNCYLILQARASPRHKELDEIVKFF